MIRVLPPRTSRHETRATAPVSEDDVVERAAEVFVERLDRLIEQGLPLVDARRVALVVALASIADEPGPGRHRGDCSHQSGLLLALRRG